MVRSFMTLGGQCLLASHVSVSIAACRRFSSNRLIRESIFSTKDLALAQAILRLLAVSVSRPEDEVVEKLTGVIFNESELSLLRSKLSKRSVTSLLS